MTSELVVDAEITPVNMEKYWFVVKIIRVMAAIRCGQFRYRSARARVGDEILNTSNLRITFLFAEDSESA